MKINIIQPMMSHQAAPTSMARVLQPVQNTAYLLAALVPDGHEVKVTDEFAGPADPESDDSDLVGITFVTGFARHAYDLARRYREKGTKVVFGGPHTTLMPGEAMKHADAIVLGEADETWPQLIRDLEANKLQAVYRAPKPPDPSIIPRSRHDLVDRRRFYMSRSLQASRGCPFSCEYCSLPGFYGAGWRPRPIKALLAEIESLDWKPGDPPIIFWDDNLIGNHRWAREFFIELRALKIEFFSEATITIADDPDLAYLAGRAGCAGLFCGLESFSEASLAGVRKAFNRVRDYKRKIQLLHDNGIMIMAGMVFGFDEDTPDIFEISVEAAQEIALDAVSAGTLVPFPGTPVYDKMNREGRILTRDWSLYDAEHVVIRPKKMTPEQLDEGMRWARKAFYTPSSIATRLWRSRTKLHYNVMMNLSYLLIAQNGGDSPGIPSGTEPGLPAHDDVVKARTSLPVFSAW